MGRVAHPVRPADIADDVVVEVGDDVPALSAGVVGEQLAPVQPLLLAREQGIDDRSREFMLRQHPRRLEHRRRARAVVVGAGCIGGGVHHVADPAVDMPGDDHDIVRPLGPALDGDDVGKFGRLGDSLALHRRGRAFDDKAPTARRRVRLELRLAPVERGADAALRITLRGEGVARSEADQRGDIGAQPDRTHRRHNLAQFCIGRRRRGGRQ